MGKIEPDKLVSVIIPVFNNSLFLNEALDSVISQSYSNLEIIVIDDGSSDSSGEICDQYSIVDNRVRVFHQINQGLSYSRNYGLDLANGDFVAFLDADDAYHPDFIKILINSMKCENTDIAVCKYTIHRSNQKMFGKKYEQVFPAIAPGVYSHDVAMRSLAEFSITSAVWNKIYKKSLWNDIRFPNGRVHEDIDTLFRVLNKCKKISVVENTLYMYRKHPDSLSGNISEKYISDYIIASSHFIEFIKTNIPDLFDKEDLRIRMVSQLQHLIRYSLYYQNSYCFTHSSFFLDLRQRIKVLYREIETDKYFFSMRIEYLLAAVIPSTISRPIICICYRLKRGFSWKTCAPI